MIVDQFLVLTFLRKLEWQDWLNFLQHNLPGRKSHFNFTASVFQWFEDNYPTLVGREGVVA